MRLARRSRAAAAPRLLCSLRALAHEVDVYAPPTVIRLHFKVRPHKQIKERVDLLNKKVRTPEHLAGRMCLYPK